MAALTVADVRAALKNSHPLRWYRPGRIVEADDLMQRGYAYELVAPAGKQFDPAFKPKRTPAQMLKAGVFEGKYCNDCAGELPREWLADALKAGKLSPEGANPAVNAFKVKSRQPLAVWIRNGWIPCTRGDPDVRGWFQWYCRYWLGRRIPEVDAVQIARWRSFARHKAQILASYKRLGARAPRTANEKRNHRPRQRQALLQWAYNPYV